VSGPVVRNSAYRHDIAASFARQGALKLIGAELDAVEPGLCRVRLPITDKLHQHHGHVHGGVVGMIGDVAGGYAAMSLFEPAREILTVEYKINFLAPARGTMLVAEGRVLRAGRSITVTAVEVRAVEEDGDRLCAVLQQTCMPG